jgi:hypothetical protein
MSTSLRCVIMRGGTSKAVFLKEADIPADPEARRRVILKVYGSPDKRQIDGLGGADPLTSKLAIIGPPRRPDVHLTYTFGQVEIDHPDIDWRSLCGNISAAVGAFAIYEGMVAPEAPVTTVRAFNTNLGRVLSIEVPVAEGRPLERGDYRVPGVPGSGARILIDFADTAGGATGRLLPTGNPVDVLDVPGHGRLEVSLVDIGNAHVFLRAADLGLAGTETAAEIDARGDLRALLERIRGLAAQRMGMLADGAQSVRETPATPLLAMVSPPADYRNALAGGTVAAAEVDLVSRLMFMQQMHKTYAGTSTVCTGVASRLPGTLVQRVARSNNRPAIRIGHPAGVIETESEIAPDGRVLRATLGRTARRILEGYVFVPDGDEASPEVAA